MLISKSYRKLRFWLRQTSGKDPKLQREHQCRNTLRLGSDYGGWWVCPDDLDQASIVYAVGVGTDISFDLGMIHQFGLTLHAFDPTPKSIAWVRAQQLPPQFVLHEVGVADYDGVAQFFSPKNTNNVSHSIVQQRYVSDEAIEVKVARLTTIMGELGHDHLDLLK
jgi:FkbM family methyltransferase